MIQVELQNTAAVLRTLARTTSPRTLRTAIMSMAESYTDDTLDFIQQGRGFQNRTGQLAQSIGWRPTGQDSAQVYANASYAAFVEFGTRPHVIMPKPGRKALKIPVAGGYILRRKVNHPGSRRFPYFFADRPKREERMIQRALDVIIQAAQTGN